MNSFYSTETVSEGSSTSELYSTEESSESSKTFDQLFLHSIFKINGIIIKKDC